MTTMTTCEDWSLGDPFISNKGAKSCRLIAPNGKAVCTIDDWTVSPFGPSTFDRDGSAPRQNFEIRVTGAALETFKGIDEWARHYILQHCERLLDKKLDAEQIREMYRPLLSYRHSDPMLRCKISMPNALKPTRIWTTDGKQGALPEGLLWRETEICAKTHVSHLWIMGSQFGLVLNLTDLCYRGGAAIFPIG